ncbi:short-chain dehydrogenase [Amylocarpus encephaloides]|uniref:Short-chain dehydrogenase n=1 Tax=Amylocarpus encephaloides TaxID=45428 RepID=A0A9P7YL16_9HELO|nr:short-chain dehydrogenase [Amylocarpus encephaloides]
MPDPTKKTYLIIGASRGIGLELTSQLLDKNQFVIATERVSWPEDTSPGLFSLSTTHKNSGNVRILNCDVSKEESVTDFVQSVESLLVEGLIDVAIFNAGILEYPARVSDFSRYAFSHHLQINALGPLQAASLLLANPLLTLRTLVFVSSDSGSASQFLSHEDGFAAYSMSKVALNQGLRHLSYELVRKYENEKSKCPVVLAIHPGEVKTDMASSVNLVWEVPGQISVGESVEGVLRVVEEKGWSREVNGNGGATFWDWNGDRHPW